MEYTILGGNTIQIVTTTVEFTFEDGSIEVFDIPHFNPNNDDDIIKGIENRFVTEQAARNEVVEDLQNNDENNAVE